jgi:hypothetical protein
MESNSAVPRTTVTTSSKLPIAARFPVLSTKRIAARTLGRIVAASNVCDDRLAAVTDEINSCPGVPKPD